MKTKGKVKLSKKDFAEFQVAVTGAFAPNAALQKALERAAKVKRIASPRPDKSERTERLGRIFAAAQYVWENEEDAFSFMTTEHPLLNGSTPLDVSTTELGAKRVEELLWKIFYGIAV